MDILVRKYLNKLIHHILAELDHGRIGHIENIGRHSRPVAHRVRAAGIARKLRISRNGRFHVAGHIHFRNHLDVAFLGIRHNILKLVYRVIERSVRLVEIILVVIFKIPPVGIGGGGSLGDEFGVFGYLQTPALVVG